MLDSINSPNDLKKCIYIDIEIQNRYKLGQKIVDGIINI